jgi:hypothetical protein
MVSLPIRGERSGAMLVRVTARVLGAILATSIAACSSFGSDDGPVASDAGPNDGATAVPDGASPDGGALPDGGAMDGSVDGSTVLFGPPCNKAPACDRVVFATSATFKGDFGGSAKADEQCMTAASSSKIDAIRKKTFKAWVSDGFGANAKDRLVNGTGKYLRSDGVIIATDLNSLLVKRRPMNPIQADENGMLISGLVWTGSDPDGVASSGSPAVVSCAGWTTPLQQGITGQSTAATDEWSYVVATTSCSVGAHFYCFED